MGKPKLDPAALKLIEAEGLVAEEAHWSGYQEGYDRSYQEVLTLLENDYMEGEYPRGSIEARVCLELTRKIGKQFRKQRKNLKRPAKSAEKK